MESAPLSVRLEGTDFSELARHPSDLASSPSIYASDSEGSQLSTEFNTDESTRMNISAGEVYVTAAESFNGLSLAEAMPRHTLRLERERDEALAKNEPRRAARRTFDNEQPPLDDLLKPHKGRLEKARDAALEANEPRKSPVKAMPEFEPLDAVLKPHKCRLQREKEAALAKNEPRRPPRRIIEEQPPLESMLKRSYSRLEREKQALAAQEASASPRKEAVSAPRSRLAMEKEQAELMAAAASGSQAIDIVEDPAEAHVDAVVEPSFVKNEVVEEEEESSTADVAIEASNEEEDADAAIPEDEA